jgi:hypothetical protein
LRFSACKPRPAPENLSKQNTLDPKPFSRDVNEKSLPPYHVPHIVRKVPVKLAEFVVFLHFPHREAVPLMMPPFSPNGLKMNHHPP